MPSQPKTFSFRFDRNYLAAGLPFGVTPMTTKVVVGSDELRARFGPWRLVTPLANIVSTQVTGPYSFARAAGPARLSFTDRGLTFATNGERGLCLRFARPVPGIDPTRRLLHPGLTVTVEDIDGLAAAVGHPVT